MEYHPSNESVQIPDFYANVSDLLNEISCAGYRFGENESLVNSSGIMGLSGASNTSLEAILCFPNKAHSLIPSSSRAFAPRFVLQLLWAVVFGVMVIVAAGGNLIVIWIVIWHRNMRTVTNYFLLNLSVLDLMMAIFNAMFNFVFMITSTWPFGSIYCSVNNFIAHLTVASSVFTITATSIDRYVAVVHPLKPRMSRRKALIIIILIWFCGALLALPNLLYSRAYTYYYQDGERTICFLVWPDGKATGHSQLDYIYNIWYLILVYAAPMAVLLVTYSIMGHVLWASKGIGEESDAQRESLRSKQKVVRMLITVVVTFGFCWLPYHAYFVATYHFPEVFNSEYIQHVYLAFYWLAMSNSMYNPILYCWMNKRFRNYFSKALSCFIPGSPRNEPTYADRSADFNNSHRHPCLREGITQEIGMTMVSASGPKRRAPSLTSSKVRQQML